MGCQYTGYTCSRGGDCATCDIRVDEEECIEEYEYEEGDQQ